MPKTRTSGIGRPKGIPNKLTSDIKGMILAALDEAGGSAYLLKQAKENPGPFMVLVGKILPTQVTGRDGGPIQFEDVSEDTRASIDSMLAEFVAARDAESETKH